MVVYDEDMDNFCDGCAVRNTGDNFSHPGLCKSCMSAMMDAPHEEILKGEDHLTDRLARNADDKNGPLTSWLDTDGAEVEITLPLPPGTTKKDLRIKSSTSKLLVADGERRLLFVDPLYDEVVPDEMVWCIEASKDGTPQMQISLSKFHPGTRWGKTLCKEGGTFECWKNQLLEDPAAQGARALSAASAKKLPRFTMRDDGGEVEVNLPLPADIESAKDLQVKATPTSLVVCAGDRELMQVKPLYADIVSDELVWTLEKAKDGQMHAQITMAKFDSSITWESSLTKEGGTFTCWTAEL